MFFDMFLVKLITNIAFLSQLARFLGDCVSLDKWS